MLKLNDYRYAIDAQGACNLSGIVHTFDKIVSRIWEEATDLGHGTDYVNQHCISRLFAEQILYLSGGGIGNSDTYSEAMKVCERKCEEMRACEKMERAMMGV